MTKQLVEDIYDKYMDVIGDYMSKGTTYTNELDRICKSLFDTSNVSKSNGNKFKGVYAADNYPKLGEEEMCIINLDKSSEPGSHWVCIYKKNEMIYFYDSFGRNHKNILPSLEETNEETIINTELDPEQEEKEKNCGLRCCVALYMMNLYGPEKIAEFL